MSEEPGETPNDLLAELDLAAEEIPLRLKGALTREHFVSYERDLTLADMVALELPRGGQPKSLQRIHASHHALAKCIASGIKDNQAALVTGYSTSRIGLLKKDPVFQALVADYCAEARTWSASLAERMVGLSLDAMELLQERLHSKPDDISVPVLLDIIRAFADRTGHGPGQQISVTVDQNLIDRPPRESFEEWEERRGRELKLLN